MWRYLQDLLDSLHTFHQEQTLGSVADSYKSSGAILKRILQHMTR